MAELTITVVLRKQRIKIHHVLLLVLLQQRQVWVHEQRHNSKAEMWRALRHSVTVQTDQLQTDLLIGSSDGTPPTTSRPMQVLLTAAVNPHVFQVALHYYEEMEDII